MATLSITEGNAAVLDVDVTNRGDISATADIVLEVDTTEEDRDSSIEIAPGETYRTVLAWQTESGDAQAADYDVCAETSQSDRNDCITVNVS